MSIEQVQNIIKNIDFRLFGQQFHLEAHHDKEYPNGRIFLQVRYHDRCRKTGKYDWWGGRKWYLSKYMTTDEIIKTAFAACKAAVEHEIMEGFTVEGTVLFNPHVDYRELLVISHKEVKREEITRQK